MHICQASVSNRRCNRKICNLYHVSGSLRPNHPGTALEKHSDNKLEKMHSLTPLMQIKLPVHEKRSQHPHTRHTSSLQLHPHTHHIVAPGFVDRPRRSDCTAGQMDGEAGWWTTSGNIGLPPLARVMGVGRQQQQIPTINQPSPVFLSSHLFPLIKHSHIMHTFPHKNPIFLLALQQPSFDVF